MDPRIIDVWTRLNKVFKIPTVQRLSSSNGCKELKCWKCLKYFLEFEYGYNTCKQWLNKTAWFQCIKNIFDSYFITICQSVV